MRVDARIPKTKAKYSSVTRVFDFLLQSSTFLPIPVYIRTYGARTDCRKHINNSAKYKQARGRERKRANTRKAPHNNRSRLGEKPKRFLSMLCVTVTV